MPSDLNIVEIIPVSPLGVHHEVLAIDPGAKDGEYKCQAIGTNWTPLFASGVGSPSLTTPTNVALKVTGRPARRTQPAPVQRHDEHARGRRRRRRRDGQRPDRLPVRRRAVRIDPGVRQRRNLPADAAAAPTSRPQVGCATISTFGAASISRPTMNFCRLPPDRVAARLSGPRALTPNRSMSRARQPPRAAAAQPPARRRSARAREQRVVGQRQRRDGAATDALLGDEAQPQRAPRARRGRRDVASR